MPNFKPLDATSGDDDDDKDDGFLNDDSDEQGVGNDSVRQSPRLTSPPRKTTTMVSVPASSSSSKLPGIVMNSASTSTMRSSSNAAMAVASSSNSAMTPSAPLPSSGPAPRNFITESQGVTSSPRSFNPADPRYTTATSPPKSAASTASHNTLGTPSLWSRVFGGKEPSQITHLRQLGNNVKSISSAQFKQQMDKFSGHRPANLYDPHHENDDGSPSQMDAATFRVRFLAFQQRLHMFLEDPSSSFASLVCNMLLILIIVIGTISMCLETVDGLYIDNPGIWFAIDTFVTFIFTVELLARLTARCTSRRSFFGFLTSFPFLIDFLAVLPYYLEFVLPKAEEELLESGGLAGLRLIRIFRLLKMFRFMSQVRYVSLSFEVAGESIRKSIGPLFPMFAAGAISVIILSTLIYYAERGVEDTKLGYRVDANGNKSKFSSIPKTIWFTLTTVTTTGYGDMTPLTFWGKFVTFGAMITGMLLIALPSIIIGRNFSILWNTLKAKNVMPPKPEWLQRLTGGKKNSKKYRQLGADGTTPSDEDDDDGAPAAKNAVGSSKSRPMQHSTSEILKSAMSADDLAAVLAMKKVEVQGQAMTCPHCKKKVPIKTDKNGRRVSVSRGSSRGSRVSVSPLKTSSTTADGPGFLAMTSMAAPAAEPVSPTITMGDTELLRFLAAELLKANANIEKLVDASNEGIDDDMYQSESGDDATEDNSV